MKDKKLEEILDAIRSLKKQMQELEDVVVDKVIEDIENKRNDFGITPEPYNPINPIFPDDWKRNDWIITSTSELKDNK